AVDASVIAENETIETVIGQARRNSARPGRSVQGMAVELVDNRADMTTLEGLRGHGAPSYFAENKKGSWEVRGARGGELMLVLAVRASATAGHAAVDDALHRRRALVRVAAAHPILLSDTFAQARAIRQDRNWE